MHNAAFQAKGLAFTYVSFSTDDTARVIDSMRSLGFRGLSLTIPHKESALSLVDTVSEEAQSIGAINTVVNTDGILAGYNTDTVGIERALTEANYLVAGRRVLVLGAGGAARALLFTLRKLGASSILLANRTQSRAGRLAAEFQLTVIPFAEFGNVSPDSFDLLVNATPLQEVASAFSFPKLTPKHGVFELVTQETELVRTARAARAQVILGTRMLLYQAVEQFQLFTEEEAPLQVMEQALVAECMRK